MASDYTVKDFTGELHTFPKLDEKNVDVKDGGRTLIIRNGNEVHVFTPPFTIKREIVELNSLETPAFGL